MHKQMYIFVQKFSSPYMCGYRKGLLSLTEKWKKTTRQKGKWGYSNYGSIKGLMIIYLLNYVHMDSLMNH